MSIFHKNHANVTIQLHPHNLHHISEIEKGMTVMCEKGLLLVTQNGNAQDYTLRPGQRVVIGGKGDVLIEAVSEATLCVLYPN